MIRRHLATLFIATLVLGGLCEPTMALARDLDTPQAVADALSQKRAECRQATNKRLEQEAKDPLKAPLTAGEAVEVVRDLTLSKATECGELKAAILKALGPNKLLAAVNDALATARETYQCDTKPTPVCDGLKIAQRRQDDIQLFLDGKVEMVRLIDPKRYNRFLATQWSDEHGAFGSGPEIGVSLIHLTLTASGSDIADEVGPNTAYDDIRDKLGKQTKECDADCQLKVANVVSINPILHAVDSGFMAVTADNYNGSIAILDQRIGRWNAYHFGGGEGRAQLPWELLFNGVLYRSSHKHVTIDENTPLNSLWPEAPKSAWILVHPSPALAMKDAKGASLVINAVEVLGWSKWDYDETKQSRKNEKGASLVAAYRERSDASDWGYGVLVRTPFNLNSLPINVVLTRTKLDKGGHDDLLALSVDISRYIPNFKKPICFFSQNC